MQTTQLIQTTQPTQTLLAINTISIAQPTVITLPNLNSIFGITTGVT